jgi:hypothetical protein
MRLSLTAALSAFGLELLFAPLPPFRQTKASPPDQDGGGRPVEAGLVVGSHQPSEGRSFAEPSTVLGFSALR